SQVKVLVNPNQALADASLTSPIIVSRRQGDGSPHLRRCLALIGREDA
ncbi:hypothetical protein HKW75_20360, partial [Pseudomonas aeruginosa]|nr:hypothetical protein [Pseudomonas aeruginosa]